MKYASLTVLLALIACGPVPDDSIDTADTSLTAGSNNDLAQNTNEECDAAEYRGLIGTPVTDTVFPTDDRFRVFSEADIVTQEYIPQRTNVVFDTGGQIIRVFCG